MQVRRRELLAQVAKSVAAFGFLSHFGLASQASSATLMAHPEVETLGDSGAIVNGEFRPGLVLHFDLEGTSGVERHRVVEVTSVGIWFEPEDSGYHVLHPYQRTVAVIEDGRVAGHRKQRLVKNNGVYRVA